MSMVRLNITLPEDLARQLNKFVKPKQKSNFIAQTLRQRIERIQYEELQKALEEGYKVRKKESHTIAKEFEPLDLEVWDDY